MLDVRDLLLVALRASSAASGRSVQPAPRIRIVAAVHLVREAARELLRRELADPELRAARGPTRRRPPTSSSSRSWSTGSPYCAGHQSFGCASSSCGNSDGASDDLARLAGRERHAPSRTRRRPRGPRSVPATAGGARVRREHLDRQLRAGRCPGEQLRHHLRMAQRHGPARRERDRPEDAHHLVGRHRVPVDERDREVARRRRRDEHGERVRARLRGAA